VKDTLTGAIPEPGVTGEPSNAPQLQLARPDPGDAPPIDERSSHHGRRSASSKAFAYEAPEGKAGDPPARRGLSSARIEELLATEGARIFAGERPSL